VKLGLNVPIFDDLADPRLLADLAAEAEAYGWDGFFVWDHIYYRAPVTHVTDPWIALAAVASATSRIHLGPMVTPLARRRPQVVARQLVALDYVSNGRVVLGVGLGLDDSGREFSRFGEETDPRSRASIYDEALSLLQELISGESVDHTGTWFTASDVRFLPAPPRGRVPIWVGARWPNRRPIARALARDGLFIIDVEPDDLDEIRAIIENNRLEGMERFDLVVQSADPSDAVRCEAKGATWWLAMFDPFNLSAHRVREMIHHGRGLAVSA
jgi:alkanesulfonate monooxygenase SsuD/methylene tetrahydromethanopterin reductase-like flavin-dependent oxidoreductase (luciferase family)